ncbi:MAG: hypothetical protein LBT75_02220 [Bacilli bacterium]|jgi:hypothetical protein|nr:hypothetical protein [Bacilli bacterium]
MMIKHLDLNEIKRYLKIENDIDEMTLLNINKAIKLIELIVKPKYVIKKYAIELSDNQVIFKDTNLIIKSKDLVRHLNKCDEIIILVTTLGLQVDQEIKRLELTNMSMAYILNAVAIEYLEKYLDYIQKEVIKENKYQTNRYSIGYGDTSLTYQQDLLSLTKAFQLIGVHALASNMMIPKKSVSALIGLSNEEVNDNTNRCTYCHLRNECHHNCLIKEE